MIDGVPPAIPAIATAATKQPELPAFWARVWHIEQRLHLFERKIGSTFYWPVLRTYVIRRMAEESRLHAPPPAKVIRLRRQRAIIGAANSLLGQGWPRPLPQCDSLLIPFNRKSVRDGHIIDTFSDRLLDEPLFGRFTILDNHGPQGRYAPSPRYQLYDWDSVRVAAHLGGLGRSLALRAEARREVMELERDWQAAFGIGFPITAEQMAYRCAVFEVGRNISKRLFAASGARKLFIVARNSAQDAAAAAGDLKMPVIELQHGFITQYDALTHYPGRPYVPYAPDRLLTFGAHWTDAIDLPRQTAAHVIGAGHMPHRRGDAGAASRKVVILSQWTIGARLFDLAQAVAKAVPDWTFVFRPHPWEDVRVFAEKMASADASANLSIDSTAQPICELLAGAEVQIGVYSTGLFEGMMLGVRTIVPDIPGAEYMAQVIRVGDAALARDAADVVAQLATAPLCRNPGRYFAPPVVDVAAAISTSSQSANTP